MFVLLAVLLFFLSLSLKFMPSDMRSLEAHLFQGFAVGSLLLLVGLVLCIIGLIVSIKRDKSKSAAVWGMVFAIMTPVTLLMSSLMVKEPTQVMTPQSVEHQTTDYSDCVVLSLDSSGVLHCIDNRKADDSGVELNATDENFNVLFSQWITDNDISEDHMVNGAKLIVRADADADYAVVQVVLHALQDNQLNRFTLTSSMK